MDRSTPPIGIQISGLSPDDFQIVRQTLNYYIFDKLHKSRVISRGCFLQCILVGSPCLIVPLDIGYGITVLHQYQIHHETGCPAIPVNKGMNRHQFLVHLSGQYNRVHGIFVCILALKQLVHFGL